MRMAAIDLSELQKIVWQTAEDQGHHKALEALDMRLQTLVRLALVHTEVSEAWAVVDHGDPEGESLRTQVLDELADTAIRLLEMAWCWPVPYALSVATTLPREPLVSRQLARLHFLVDDITQAVKRHGVTPDTGPLTAQALSYCWGIAAYLGADLEAVIRAKDAYNRTRAYQYGTPTTQEDAE